MLTQGQGHNWRSRVLALNFVPLHISVILVEFSLNFGHIFASVRRCADPITPTMPRKVKVTIEGHEFKNFEFCIPSTFLLPLEGNAFKLGQMITSGRRCTETLTKQCRLKIQSQLNFMEFHVLSISPLPLEGFSLYFGQMLALAGWCAERIAQPWRFKVKFKAEDKKFEPWNSCSNNISFTRWKIFIKLWSNVRPSEMMCRTLHSTMPTKSRDHNWRLPVWAFNFVFSPDLLYPWKNFH